MDWIMLAMVLWLGVGGGLTVAGVRIVASNLSFGRAGPPPGHTPMWHGIAFLAVGGALLATATRVGEALSG